MACSFGYMVSCLWFFLVVTRAFYSYKCDNDENHLDQLLAPKSSLIQVNHHLAMSCIWKRNPHLHSFVHNHLVAVLNCYWLLWLAGDIEASVKFPVTSPYEATNKEFSVTVVNYGHTPTAAG